MWRKKYVFEYVCWRRACDNDYEELNTFLHWVQDGQENFPHKCLCGTLNQLFPRLLQHAFVCPTSTDVTEMRFSPSVQSTAVLLFMLVNPCAEFLAHLRFTQLIVRTLFILQCRWTCSFLFCSLTTSLSDTVIYSHLRKTWEVDNCHHWPIPFQFCIESLLLINFSLLLKLWMLLSFYSQPHFLIFSLSLLLMEARLLVLLLHFCV